MAQLVVSANAYSSVLSEWTRSLNKSTENSTLLFDFEKLNNSAGSTMQKVEIIPVEGTTPGFGGTYHVRAPNWGKLAGVHIKFASTAVPMYSTQGGTFPDWTSVGLPQVNQAMAIGWINQVSLDTMRGTTIETFYQPDLVIAQNRGSIPMLQKKSLQCQGYLASSANAFETAWPALGSGQTPVQPGVTFIQAAPLSAEWEVDCPFSALQDPMTQPDLASTEQMQVTINLSGNPAIGGRVIQNTPNQNEVQVATAITGGPVPSVIFYMIITSQSDRLRRQALEFRQGVSTIPLINRYTEAPQGTSFTAGNPSMLFQLRCKSSVKYTTIFVQSGQGVALNDFARTQPIMVQVMSGGTLLWSTNSFECLSYSETGDAQLAPTVFNQVIGAYPFYSVQIPWGLIRDQMMKMQTVACEGACHLSSLAAPTVQVTTDIGTTSQTAGPVFRDGNSTVTGPTVYPKCFIQHEFYQASQYVTNSSGIGFSWAVTDID